MTIETPTPSEMESMIASAKASSNAEMTAAPQMPSEPRQCQHGNWNAADCKDCKIKSLQAEVERLRAAFESEESEMCKQLNDECNALTNRAESAERKLAEYTDERGIVRCRNIATCLDTENKLAEAEAEVERLRNCYATEVRTAQAYLRRTEQSERKLAEAEALRKYGRHEEDCMFEMALNKHYKCTCGFDEATK